MYRRIFINNSLIYTKPERCKICEIKICAHEKGYDYCYECNDFPCKVLKNMEKSYTKRYATSLLGNSKIVKEKGIKHFESNEKVKWTCKKCNGVISLHDGVCSECEDKHENYSKRLTLDQLEKN